MSLGAGLLLQPVPFIRPSLASVAQTIQHTSNLTQNRLWLSNYFIAHHRPLSANRIDGKNISYCN